MSRLAPISCLAFLLAATLAAGWAQGKLTNRWGIRPNAQHAADQLTPKLPDEVGNWKLQREVEFLPQVTRILQNPAYINRIYVNQQTGDQVQIVVLVGHPGPVSVHTPEICYSARDYTISGARRKTTVALEGGATHDFWELPLKPTNPLTGSPLRVFYAWSTGAKWEAATHPRFGYGGLPHLYKLQMSVSHAGSEAKGFDAAQDFLSNFLLQLQPRMVEASRS